MMMVEEVVEGKVEVERIGFTLEFAEVYRERECYCKKQTWISDVSLANG